MGSLSNLAQTAGKSTSIESRRLVTPHLVSGKEGKIHTYVAELQMSAAASSRVLDNRFNANSLGTRASKDAPMKCSQAAGAIQINQLCSSEAATATENELGAVQSRVI